MEQHKVGDLVYDSIYHELGTIVKIWTVKELEAIKAEYPEYTIEVCYTNADFQTDRYRPCVIDNLKYNLEKMLREK